jgi:hypothetical protein
MLNRWMTIPHVRALLGVSDFGLRQYIKLNDVQTQRAGGDGQLLVRLRDLQGMRVPLGMALRIKEREKAHVS